MAKGKSIRILIPECNLQNAIEVTMPSWDGIAFCIKREYLQAAKDIAALKQCGVYFLYGTTKTSAGVYSQKVYVGQGVLRQNGKGVFWRIKEHDLQTEEYWTEAIAFVDSKKEWGKTEISYLENRFTNMILSAKKGQKNYEVVNGNTPNPGNVTRAKQWELDDYIEGATLILQVLGYDFFETEHSLISPHHPKTPAMVSPKHTANVPKGSERKISKALNSIDCFPFKVGKVMSCAFREALSTGLLRDQLMFLESKEASKLFKTRGNQVIVAGEKPNRDTGGKNRFAKEPVLFQGETYWITTQVWENGLCNILSFLEQHGMTRKTIESLCQHPRCDMQLGRRKKAHIRLKYESFFDFLRKTMCKNSASNYASSFRALNAMLIEHDIIEDSLSKSITNQKLEEVKRYVSLNKDFLAYNKKHHYSRSAALKKFLEYINVCDESDTL